MVVLFFYMLAVAASAMLRIPIAKLQTKMFVVCSSGWDEQLWADDLLPEFSISHSPGHYYAHNWRTRVATWFYTLIPFYWIYQIVTLIKIATCRLENYFSYGKQTDRFKVPSNHGWGYPYWMHFKGTHEMPRTRIEFEKWAVRHQYSTVTRQDGSYVDQSTAQAWRVWQCCVDSQCELNRGART